MRSIATILRASTMLTLGLMATTSAAMPNFAPAIPAAPQAMAATGADAVQPAEAAVAAVEAAAGTLDLAAAQRAVAQWQALEDGDHDRALRLWSSMAGLAFACDDFALAASSGERWRALLADAPDAARTDADNLFSIARLLAAAPGQRVVEYAPHAIATRRDAIDLTRANINLNGQNVEAVLDTGANLSTVSASMAAQLGLRRIDGDVAVSSTTVNALAGQVAIADQLDIAGVRLTNVVFLVLPDEQLELPVPDYRLNLIIGFPVFRAMERLTYMQSGMLLPSRSQKGDGAANIQYQGSSLFVDMRVGDIAVVAHLDTGARSSSLPTGFAAAHGELIAPFARETVRIGGAGGTLDKQIAVWTNPLVLVDEQNVHLDRLIIALPQADGPPPNDQAILGQDVLGQFPAYSIDFLARRLRLTAQP